MEEVLVYKSEKDVDYDGNYMYSLSEINPIFPIYYYSLNNVNSNKYISNLYNYLN